MAKKKRVNRKDKSSRKGPSPVWNLSRTRRSLSSLLKPVSRVHIKDVAPQMLANGVITIKDFAKKYGSPPADILLEKLQALGFPYMTQLDWITSEALEALSKSWGYDNFLEYDQQQSTYKAFSKVRVDLSEEAAKLELSSGALYSKLIYRSIKAKVERLKLPIKIFNVAYGSYLAESLVLRLFKEGSSHNLNIYSEVTIKDIELFLSKVDKLTWRHGKYIPSYLLPFLHEMGQEKAQIESDKFLQKANEMDRLHQELFNQYSPLSLKDLGAVFKGGINDLDDDDNLILKKIINQKILETYKTQ